MDVIEARSRTTDIDMIAPGQARYIHAVIAGYYLKTWQLAVITQTGTTVYYAG